MNEFWFSIRVRTFPRPVVVLDVSAAAAPLWPVLASTVEGLAESLPESAQPDVAFLGSAERVPLAEFLATMTARHAANRGRGRVLGPLLDSFRHRWPPRVVVIAARPIVDLADWHSHSRRLTVVRIDPTTNVADGLVPEIDLTDVEAVARLLRVPAPSVRIGAREGIPVAWDNPAYQFAAGQLVAADGRGGDVRVGFLSHVEKLSLTAELVRPGLDPDRLGVGLVDPAEVPAWQPFTAAELTLLDSWRSGRAAYCARCRTEHLPGHLLCPDGSSAFPSLARVPAGELVRARVKMFQATFQPAQGPALRIGEGAVVVRTRDSSMEVWRFDVAADVWRPTGEPWDSFERIDGSDDFVLALPHEKVP